MLTGEPTSEPTSIPEAPEELMRLYQEADTQAASQLIDRLSPQVFGFFLAQVRDHARAEDLLQDFWLRIHNARHTYRRGEPLLPWIYAIARRVKIDEYRRKSRIARHETQSERLPDVAGSGQEPGAALELPDLLKDLPAAQREAILLLKVAGLTIEEAARAAGTSSGAIKQRAHRGYEALRKLFGMEA